MSPAGWSAVLEARRAYAPGTSAKPSAMPGSVLLNRAAVQPESAKDRYRTIEAVPQVTGWSLCLDLISHFCGAALSKT